MGEGGSWNVHITNKAYLLKLVIEGVKDVEKWSTWFVYGPISN